MGLKRNMRMRKKFIHAVVREDNIAVFENTVILPALYAALN